MKITPKNLTLPLVALAFCLALTGTARANFTFGDPNDLGQVMFGIPSGDSDRTSYVNHLIDMAPSTNDSFSGQTFTRTSANPGPGFPNYPDAVFALNGTSTTIDFLTGTTYSYLFAKYDGTQAGSEVWYVGGVSGNQTIPGFGLDGQNYALSGWTLFGPGAGGPTPPGSVPEGGATVMLLGMAVGALGVVRRFLMA